MSKCIGMLDSTHSAASASAPALDEGVRAAATAWRRDAFTVYSADARPRGVERIRFIEDVARAVAARKAPCVAAPRPTLGRARHRRPTSRAGTVFSFTWTTAGWAQTRTRRHRRRRRKKRCDVLSPSPSPPPRSRSDPPPSARTGTRTRPARSARRVRGDGLSGRRGPAARRDAACGDRGGREGSAVCAAGTVPYRCAQRRRCLPPCRCDHRPNPPCVPPSPTLPLLCGCQARPLRPGLRPTRRSLRSPTRLRCSTWRGPRT